MAWVSPTGYGDPSSRWSDETYAYDGNEANFAKSNKGDEGCLELTLGAAISCDKVWIKASSHKIGDNDPDISLDVYYSGAWHNIFSGVITANTWVEKTIGSTESVDKARVIWNALAGGNAARVYEFDFNEVVTRVFAQHCLI